MGKDGGLSAIAQLQAMENVGNVILDCSFSLISIT
jgi:hypothetical protein